MQFTSVYIWNIAWNFLIALYNDANNFQSTKICKIRLSLTMSHYFMSPVDKFKKNELMNIRRSINNIVFNTFYTLDFELRFDL